MKPGIYARDPGPPDPFRALGDTEWLRRLVANIAGADLLTAEMHSTAQLDGYVLTLTVEFPCVDRPPGGFHYDPTVLPSPTVGFHREVLNHECVIPRIAMYVHDSVAKLLMLVEHECQLLGKRVQAIQRGEPDPGERGPVPYHDDDPDWRDEAPDLTEYVTGARVLLWVPPGHELTEPVHGQIVGHGPMLTSSGAGMRGRHRWRAGHALRAECLLRAYGHLLSAHAAPAPGCHCGFNAFHDVGTLLDHADERTVGTFNVIALVRAWGQLEVHAEGFRSEWVEPIAIVKGLRLKDARAAAEYSGLPLVDAGPAADDFAAEYGSPVPAELRHVDVVRDEFAGLRSIVSRVPGHAVVSLVNPMTGQPQDAIMLKHGDRLSVNISGEQIDLGYNATNREPVLLKAPVDWWMDYRPAAGKVIVGDLLGPHCELHWRSA